MRQRLEIIINRLMNVCATGNKEAEIALKINLDSIKRHEFEKGKITKEWIEPKLEYQISEKIKETKNTSKGLLGINYEMQINKEDNNVYIQKINEQTSMFEEGE